MMEDLEWETLLARRDKLGLNLLERLMFHSDSLTINFKQRRYRAPRNGHCMQFIELCPVKNTVWGALCQNTNWKCLILTNLICGCLAAIAWCRLTEITKAVVNFNNFPITSTKRSSPCDDGYVYIPIAFVVTLYMVYLVECYHCSTRIELKYKMDVASVYDRVQQMREAQPVVWWKAICYHYVRRSRQVTRYRNGNAYTSTQVYYERINSHSAGASFVFGHCGVKDISKKLVGLEQYPATKIRLSKGFAFANIEAAAEFEDQRARFFQENERRDDYMEMREGLDLVNVNFKEYLISFANPDHLPWYVSHLIFWISSFLLVSWPLRLLIESRTAYVHYQITKLFGVNYAISPVTPNNTAIGHGLVTPSSTITSTDLEWHIRSNLGLLPSYSEALLMDTSTVDSGIESAIMADDPNGNVSLPLSRARSSSHLLLSNSPNVDPEHQMPTRGHRHSWALFCSRSSFPRGFLGLRPSVTRLSLHNGHVLYHPPALWESSNTTTIHRCPIKATTNRGFRVNSSENPPDYDVAIQVSRPLSLATLQMLQQSQTDCEIQHILQQSTTEDYIGGNNNDALRIALDDNETAL